MDRALSAAAQRRAGLFAGILIAVSVAAVPAVALAAGNVAVTKAIVHPTYGNSQSVTSTTQFTVYASCGGGMSWGAFQIQDGQTSGLSGTGAAVGASCSASETLPPPFAGNCPVPLVWQPVAPVTWTMPPSGTIKNVAVVNTYKCPTPPGGLRVMKVVSGPAGTSPPNTPFAISVTCKDLLNVSTTYPLSLANGGIGAINDLVPGSQCQISETPAAAFTSNSQTCTWNAPVYSPQNLTIVSGQNSVTVTNAYTCTGGSSVLKICKKAGSGIPVGKAFGFSVNGNPVTVSAGPANSGGYCTLGGTFVPGTIVSVKEVLSAGLGVKDITVRPADRLVALDVEGGKVDVKMGSGVTEATFTNERPTTGFLEICKRGDAAGTFSFTVNPGNLGPFVVPQGMCSPAIEVQAGQVSITEAPAANSFMSSCATVPAGRQVACNLGTRTSVVTVPAGYISSQTIAFITNKGFGTPPGPPNPPPAVP